MSIFSVLGSIVGALGKVVGVVGSIISVAKPILENLRPAIKEVDVAMDWLEENATMVGEEADDFLDRNLPVINDLEMVSARGVVVFGEINQLTVELRRASQEVTPDTITEEEAAAFIERFRSIKEALGLWGPEVDKALASMAVAEKEG